MADETEATDGFEGTNDVAAGERRAIDARSVVTTANEFGFVMVASLSTIGINFASMRCCCFASNREGHENNAVRLRDF